MTVGVGVLAAGFGRVRDPRQRRGVALVLIGSVAGLLPFLIAAVAAPEALVSDRSAPAALALLGLVPLTFAVAIVRFGLLDIRVMLRRSLAYSVLTAGVTALYAGGIALFNGLTRGSALAASPWFPVVFALAIALLFEPLRRRSQRLVDGALFGERRRLQEATPPTESLRHHSAYGVPFEPVSGDRLRTSSIPGSASGSFGSYSAKTSSHSWSPVMGSSGISRR
jgi:hypothetical protein